ncbi:hypothetical protein O181_053007 [Austropuccinia psidii MF-1]|uniref:Uncharacterized protein n=1 Tax=Austropuccinia psidii MF-1 TaxID=1389203 RepID=A0A9Q3E431_9BASI|nr:hypothetical protein [Austropuccinia psidii MF-1]
MEKIFIPLETQSQGSTPVIPAEPKGSKGKGKRHSESLITANKWTQIANQKSIEPQNSASIKDEPTLTTCTGTITIINPVVTSKGKVPKSVARKFVQGKVKEDREDLKEDTLDAVVDSKTLREVIPTLPFTFQFNRTLKPEDWNNMGQALQLHQLLKDLFQCSMDNKRFNLTSHWAELGASFQKICLKEISFADLIVITKGWNPTGQFKLFEERETRIRENQATIQAIEEKLNQTGPTLIPSGSKRVDKPMSPVASHHTGTSR